MGVFSVGFWLCFVWVLVGVFLFGFCFLFVCVCGVDCDSCSSIKEVLALPGLMVHGHDEVCTPGSVSNAAVQLSLSGFSIPKLNSLAAASLGQLLAQVARREPLVFLVCWFVGAFLGKGGGSQLMPRLLTRWLCHAFDLLFTPHTSEPAVDAPLPLGSSKFYFGKLLDCASGSRFPLFQLHTHRVPFPDSVWNSWSSWDSRQQSAVCPPRAELPPCRPGTGRTPARSEGKAATSWAVSALHLVPPPRALDTPRTSEPSQTPGKDSCLLCGLFRSICHSHGRCCYSN